MPSARSPQRLLLLATLFLAAASANTARRSCTPTSAVATSQATPIVSVPESVPTTDSIPSPTSAGPDLTTITNCPAAPTYNGTPDLCFAPSSLPAACEHLTSSFAPFALTTWLASCKAVLNQFGAPSNTAASACFPTSVAYYPAATAASTTASNVYACINAPSVSLICQYDADCVTETYTVGQVPTPTPTIGVDALGDGGTFEDGTLGGWVITQTSASTSVKVDGVRPHSGQYGLHFAFDNTVGGETMLFRTVRVVPGKQYQYNMYYWNNNPSSYVGLSQYVFPIGLTTSAPDASLTGGAGGQWLTETITFTATTSWVQLWIGFGANVYNAGNSAWSDDVYVDDITLTLLA